MPPVSSGAVSKLKSLRQERDLYKRKYLAANKALTRVLESFGKMGDMFQLMSPAQATVDHALGM